MRAAGAAASGVAAAPAEEDREATGLKFRCLDEICPAAKATDPGAEEPPQQPDQEVANGEEDGSQSEAA